ncbi:DUF4402 domain-containing protein [Vibrio owensii]|uniref:DUF4402 domain-containing protein n=1 Tax=Vibrio harveyi group TaxID=717610 RepID=UPI003CC5892B
MKSVVKSLLALSVALGSFGANATDAEFDVMLTLLEPITITNVSPLDFGVHVGGEFKDISVEPSSSSAAVFNATGMANKTASVSVVEKSIELTTGDGATADKQITVDNFTYGGAITSSNQVTFDAAGAANDLRVGASAIVQEGDIGGEYEGTATLRVTYL